MKEAQIENLVTAKGYADCVAFMGDDSISVVVSKESGELTSEDVAKIMVNPTLFSWRPVLVRRRTPLWYFRPAYETD